MNFDLNFHFKKYNHNLFFEQKSYSDLRADIVAYSLIIKNMPIHSVVGLKIKSPYLAFVALFALRLNNTLAVIISHHETHLGILALKKQIDFDLIIEDFHFDQLTSTDNNSSFEIDFEKIALVIFSSGTTSAQKGVALSFNNLYYSALGFSHYFKQQETDSSIINLPHHHVSGLMILWRAFFSGGRIVTNLEDQVDFLSLVPIQLKRMLDNKLQHELLKKIRVLLIGGAPLSSSLKEKALSLGLSLYETYGMTETTSLVLVNGEVLPYRQVRLDELGFFNVAGETLAKGYFKDQLFIPFTDEWLKTHDLGTVSSVGKFLFQKRADLIFISGGENINPLEIEEVVKNHPNVSDAYLVSIPDENWGEIGVLLYETKDLSLIQLQNFSEELKQYLKSILHPHLIPKFFFNSVLKKEGQLKAKRSELKGKALDLYTKSLFSYELIQSPLENAPLLILFHGFMGDKFELLDVALPLISNYSILTIDMPGHGQTKIENFSSVQDILTKLAHFIKLFSLTPLYYGYSMGGRIALQLSLYHLPPTQLILESASLGLNSDREKSERLNKDQSMFAGIKQSELCIFLERWYENPMFNYYKKISTFRNDCEKKSAHDFRQWDKSQSFLSVAVFPLASEVIKDLKKSNFSLSYIAGVDDEKYRSIALTLLAQKRKKTQIVEITGAGHNPHKTHPHKITDFLIKTLK